MEKSKKLSERNVTQPKDENILEFELLNLQEQHEKASCLEGAQASGSANLERVNCDEVILGGLASTTTPYKKFDLSGWKYSEIRDTINSSCDVELIKACCDEINRRKKIYETWHANNEDSPSKPPHKDLKTVSKYQQKMDKNKKQKQDEDANKFLSKRTTATEAKELSMERKISLERQKSEQEQKRLQEENIRLKKQIELERLARHELAMRLTEGPKLSHLTTVPKDYDLSSWTFVQLREMIKVSSNSDLLEACQEELHKRMKVYHSWKASLKSDTSKFEDNVRVPVSLIGESASPPTNGIKSKRDQRFFRIPLEGPNAKMMNIPADPSQTSQKGWWFAHFDGDWIARQMELHPGRDPILLVAGKDDLKMCELRLEETGLGRKRGAEILESDFENEWSKHGGHSYVPIGK